MHRSVRRLTVTVVTAALATAGLVVPALPAVAEPTATDVLISEYIEGASNNKAIEIANPTGAPVALGGMSLQYFSNGSVTPSLTIALSGTVAADDVFVVAHGSAVAAILAQADLTNSAGWFNGNDAVVLRRGDVVVDSLGQVGFDPVTEWGTDLTSTMDNTLRRNANVCGGDTNPSDAFVPALQWQGFAVGTYDGLGVHTSDCDGTDPDPATPIINEFSADTLDPDVEYLELLEESGADLSGSVVLEVEGDAGSPIGTVDEVIPLGTADADGRYLVELAAGTLEDGSISLLVVNGFTGAVGDDLDVEDDGVLDPGNALDVVDAVAVWDGAPSDVAYGGTVLDAGDGTFGDHAPGGASRIPDGTDTGSPADWVRNDFDLAGLPDVTGTPVLGEALNTPGAANAIVEVVEDLCEAEVVTIGSVQGSGPASTVAGSTVDVEGVVTGDFQGGGALNGYYVQDGGDGDSATSDGIFVYSPDGLDVSAGDVVHVRGAVSEFNGLTEITVDDADVCDSGAALPQPVALQMPATDEVRESLEGTRVVLPQSLAVLDLFTYPRFGELSLGLGRQFQPTAVVEPGSPERTALIAKQLEERIWLDDGRGVQNPDPLRHPNGAAFTRDNSVRSGDLVTNATGILDWRFDVWRIQPTQGAGFSANPRPAVPDVGGTTTVASFNVLNYFTTLDQPNVPGDQRGANDQEEFERQEAKIVAALAAIDADVFGLIEIENNAGVALDALVEALNAATTPGRYAALHTPKLGTDAITTALIYQPAEVAPVGPFAVLDSTVDPDFAANNRPALAQTFTDLEVGGEVTVVVNHLKSKGSDCDALGDPDTGDGQGNCNLTRVAAAEALAEWLQGDPTRQGTVGRELIIGDLNSYDHEDPIDALRTAGYTDLELREHGEYAYSYNFDGELGYLDYALAGTDLADDVTGAGAWTINSDESALYDYNREFKSASQFALWAPDPYRSSDHDPVVVGLDLTPPDTTAPELAVSASPDAIFPPNKKLRNVSVEVVATDDSGGPVSVDLVSATAAGGLGEIKIDSDTEFRMRATLGAVYTLVYSATDEAGNVTTASVVVRVIR